MSLILCLESFINIVSLKAQNKQELIKHEIVSSKVPSWVEGLGFRLVGLNFQVHANTHILSQCVFHCFSSVKCASINFNGSICELNFKTHAASPGRLKRQSGFLYLTRRSAEKSVSYTDCSYL